MQIIIWSVLLSVINPLEYISIMVLLFSRGHVVLMPDFSLPLEYYLIPFLIIVGICLILIVIFMVDKCTIFSTCQ